jgi:hypothetical protein
MTQDEIIEMARQAGMEQDGDMWFSNLYKTDMDVHISHLETFAHLVAAKEREACAKVADEYAEQVLEHNFSKLIAHNIRARGEA